MSNRLTSELQISALGGSSVDVLDMKEEDWGGHVRVKRMGQKERGNTAPRGRWLHWAGVKSKLTDPGQSQDYTTSPLNSVLPNKGLPVTTVK
ncbi:hypothetical protein EYF80_011292 [Liparis tanakae]|uniref:Uncharacterized protein n=1 Tax=Liparis tanakae TaxID=230148 RepID=A0A4Z2IKH9_9TELE|nr:hypothetical protein EYF80_011292 [Liparis tanakae]